ncbi:MAG: hypothetical protein IJ357_08660 [Oscillospiraceae bacterium]|nr:hypothetical protein [Oscillospiraceae bacterium]
MAVLTENFRSAFNGFHRTDVVQFIQRLTAEHERETRLLKEENERLLRELESVRENATALQLANETLTEELSRAAAAAETPAVDAPLPTPQTVVAAAPVDFNELELAAYRRAEMTERMARERAAASAERMKAVFAQADAKLNLTAQDLDTLMGAFRSNYEQVLQALDTAHRVMDESSAGLNAAADLCGEL